MAGRKKQELIMELALDKINNPELAVRTVMSREKLDQLKDSIERIGLQQPIIVKKLSGGKYEIVMGERRFVAHQELEMATVRAIESKMDAHDYEIAKYDENNAREDINAMDEARYIARLNKKFGKSQKELAAALGKSEAYISQRLTIMNAPEIIRDALESGTIGFSVARELAQIDDIRELESLLHFAAQNGITPAVAKSWRLSYESKKALEGNDAPDPAAVDIGQTEPDTTKFYCQGCRSATPINEMKIVKVCPACDKTFKTTEL